jgi:hypothetical protein
VKLSDRIDQFKAEVTSTPEGKKKGIKLAAAAGCFLLALVVVAFRLMTGGSEQPLDKGRPMDEKAVSEVAQMAAELEQATAEETEAFKEAVASGDAPAPPPEQEIIREHPKGVGYLPGYTPGQEPTPSEPEPEEPEDPG